MGDPLAIAPPFLPSGIVTKLCSIKRELAHTADARRFVTNGKMSNLGRNLLITIITAVICGILLYAAIRY
jgi:hypothetical protein